PERDRLRLPRQSLTRDGLVHLARERRADRFTPLARAGLNAADGMQATAPWQLLADAVLLTHVALVLFVVGGLVLIVIGNWRGWPRVNRPWFRALHLAAILI